MILSIFKGKIMDKIEVKINNAEEYDIAKAKAKSLGYKWVVRDSKKLGENELYNFPIYLYFEFGRVDWDVEQTSHKNFKSTKIEDIQKINSPISFFIDQPSDPSAGINGFTDEVTISCESGDFGGEKNEFKEYMRSCLKEWYDGAKVK